MLPGRTATEPARQVPPPASAVAPFRGSWGSAKRLGVLRSASCASTRVSLRFFRRWPRGPAGSPVPSSRFARGPCDQIPQRILASWAEPVRAAPGGELR